jgi:hypothetical protein
MFYDPYDPTSYKRKPLTRESWHKPETSWLVIGAILFIIEIVAVLVYGAIGL